MTTKHLAKRRFSRNAFVVAILPANPHHRAKLLTLCSALGIEVRSAAKRR
jgi:hypothetical protein